ncbi:Clo7bot family Cys-rich peptide [Clostridium tepidum]|uniref:Clo7bot family Cys-rich peptide n=1 Tax=Clostridium tepidum TaxID=1962263 RepID=A0A1S9IHU2_9CLOT|nr:Clo7bot family Cys-rich peptide [Clostridium tepidum]MCR1934577.1 Clo7bot family Cys-rich peptide [Clostridium tepidum]MDU6877610.1 Clo7bot family Cys-rich peptide [Clostridium botulinum]OOO62545.1 Clo7bot family Cys-rich peptide [Clostridium tepidum]OOO69823.1 Clo7bot family Cys-rich peptide [Clostridium tepidum]
MKFIKEPCNKFYLGFCVVCEKNCDNRCSEQCLSVNPK